MFHVSEHVSNSEKDPSSLQPSFNLVDDFMWIEVKDGYSNTRRDDAFWKEMLEDVMKVNGPA